MATQRPAVGVATDSAGNPVDPSDNVRALSEAASKRQDDLRDAFEKRFLAELAQLRDLVESHARHQRELDKAESDRLNSIRQVDREEVTKTAAQSLTAIQTLQATTNTTAETLRTQVATTAQAAMNQLQAMTAEINKRLSALELSSSEGKGKMGVSDPMMEKLMGRMDSLLESRSTGEGERRGINWTVAIIVASIGLFATVLTIVAALWAFTGAKG